MEICHCRPLHHHIPIESFAWDNKRKPPRNSAALYGNRKLLAQKKEAAQHSSRPPSNSNEMGHSNIYLLIWRGYGIRLAACMRLPPKHVLCYVDDDKYRKLQSGEKPSKTFNSRFVTFQASCNGFPCDLPIYYYYLCVLLLLF